MSHSILAESPLGPDVAELMARHTAAMHSQSPPESIHMLPADGLAQPGISFYVLRDAAGRAVGMGAFKQLTGPHAELKSMHVLAEMRGQGLARALLDHLIAEARATGITRLSLETGAQDAFAPARALYARAGFTECAPFEGYRPDPASVFMTREI